MLKKIVKFIDSYTSRENFVNLLSSIFFFIIMYWIFNISNIFLLFFIGSIFIVFYSNFSVPLRRFLFKWYDNSKLMRWLND